MKRLFIISILFSFYWVSATGQSLCDPFYAIGKSNKDKVWEATFQGCIDLLYPLIRIDENPLIRAQVIYKLKIKKIISKESQNSLPKTEYFNKNGYTVYFSYTNDTVNGRYYFNEFNAKNLLSSIIYKKGYSISGIRNEHSDTLHTVVRFFYNDFNKLVENQVITTSLIKEISSNNSNQTKVTYYEEPHSSTFTQTIKYDNRNNIIAIKTSLGSSYAFTYDTNNNIIAATDLRPYLVNAETWNFFYNDQKLIDSIVIKYRDKSLGSSKIKLYYNSENKLINYVKYYDDGSIWNNIKYNYSNGFLSEINDSLLSVCSTQKIYYNKEGLIIKIEYFHNGKLTNWIDYSYEFF